MALADASVAPSTGGAAGWGYDTHVGKHAARSERAWRPAASELPRPHSSQAEGAGDKTFDSFFTDHCLRSFDLAAVVALLSQVRAHPPHPRHTCHTPLRRVRWEPRLC